MPPTQGQVFSLHYIIYVLVRLCKYRFFYLSAKVTITPPIKGACPVYILIPPPSFRNSQSPVFFLIFRTAPRNRPFPLLVSSFIPFYFHFCAAIFTSVKTHNFSAFSHTSSCKPSCFQRFCNSSFCQFSHFRRSDENERPSSHFSSDFLRPIPAGLIPHGCVMFDFKFCYGQF